MGRDRLCAISIVNKESVLLQGDTYNGKDAVEKVIQSVSTGTGKMGVLLGRSGWASLGR